MINKIKALFLVFSAIFLNYFSIYGVNYRGFLSDMTYHKGKKLMNNIRQ